MLNPDSELIFPIRVLPHIRLLRGEQWKSLCDKVLDNPHDFTKNIGMVLLMAKIAGCAKCCSDSYRAIRGCTQCAKQAIKRYRGTDKELENYYGKLLLRVTKFLDLEKY